MSARVYEKKKATKQIHKCRSTLQLVIALVFLSSL